MYEPHISIQRQTEHFNLKIEVTPVLKGASFPPQGLAERSRGFISIVDFCHSPVDIRASARAGVSGSERE